MNMDFVGKQTVGTIVGHEYQKLLGQKSLSEYFKGTLNIIFTTFYYSLFITIYITIQRLHPPTNDVYAHKPNRYLQRL